MKDYVELMMFLASAAPYNQVIIFSHYRGEHYQLVVNVK